MCRSHVEECSWASELQAQALACPLGREPCSPPLGIEGVGVNASGWPQAPSFSLHHSEGQLPAVSQTWTPVLHGGGAAPPGGGVGEGQLPPL